jgi:5-bromo-4-chloroindolyl phosphate hydrolysis protein
MHDMGIQFLFKGPVPLIDIQVIIFMEIIANVNIRPSVKVDIAYGNAQPITYFAAVYAA